MSDIIAPIILLVVAGSWDYIVAPKIKKRRSKKIEKQRTERADVIFIDPTKLNK